MQLTIDIGNSLSKISCFHKDELLWQKSYQKISVGELKKVFSLEKIEASILSSVVNTDKAIINFLKKEKCFIQLSSKSKIPIINKYKTPATLGNDRLASVVGAAKLFPKKNILVIDIGTCVKYDFINSKKEYFGGSISPGFSMRFNALHKFTNKLPLVKNPSMKDFIGTTTEESMTSGVHYGMLNEMNGFIQIYKNRFKNLHVVITGGDELLFVRLLNFSIFAAPNLIPVGLNEILNHNFKHL